MIDQVERCAIRTSDLENGSSDCHSIHEINRFEDSGSDADYHAGRIAVDSRAP